MARNRTNWKRLARERGKELIELELANAKLRDLITECRPYVLASNMEDSAALYSRLIFTGS